MNAPTVIDRRYKQSISEQEQRRFFDVAAEGVHVFRTYGAVDNSVVTTAGDDEAMTDDEKHAVKYIMAFFNPAELIVNRSIALGVYPYLKSAECHLFLARWMFEDEPRAAVFTPRRWHRRFLDRDGAY